jgi:hypothetical protein
MITCKAGVFSILRPGTILAYPNRLASLRIINGDNSLKPINLLTIQTAHTSLSYFNKFVYLCSSVKFLRRMKRETHRQNRPPDSTLQPNADFAIPHHMRHNTLVCIFCYQSRHCHNLISVVPALNERHTLVVERD